MRRAVLCTRCATSLLVGLMLTLPTVAAPWKPAAGPLQTRWTPQVSPTNCLPDYPRPTMVRTAWQNLNGLWDYAIAPATTTATPTDWQGQILVPYPVESQLSGVAKSVQPDQKLWYKRSFATPAAWRGQHVLLHFGAVDWDTTVMVNGQTLGSHRGGYDGFDFDITPALRPTGPQELVVAVTDPSDRGGQPHGKQVLKPGGIMYTATTGIWQTVWLEPVPVTAIASLKSVPDVDGGMLRLTVTANGGTVEASAYDSGTLVGRATGQPGHELELRLAQPKLWTPDAPHLYELRVALRDGGKTLDAVQSYFGMRKISLGKDAQGVTRMMLNGKFVFEVGFLDQGFWPDGLYTAPTDAALRYDIEVTKQLGMNLARKHVKVEPERWYYWCDKLGLLVWQDMPAGGNGSADDKRQFEAEMHQMVLGRGNHPSIIVWVPFNEGWGQHDTPHYVDLIKQWDPTRLVNNASGWTDQKVGDLHDVHSYPRPACPPKEENRACVLGEFGGLGLGVDGHTWVGKGWGYRQEADRTKLTESYVKLLREAYRLKDEAGLCAVVYTQTSDVEVEQNGLMTYDRALIKPDPALVARANRGLFPPAPKEVTVVPTSEKDGQTWRYTLARPADGWNRPGFDDTAWKQGPGGFGTEGTPGAVVRTEWRGADIWLRRTVALKSTDFKNLSLRLHHDEDVEVYLNGVQALKLDGYIGTYELFGIEKAALAALKPGDVTLAVHCHQTGGGQFVDMGLVDLVP